MHVQNLFGGGAHVFDFDAIDRARTMVTPAHQPVRPVCFIDASSGRKDSWTWGFGAWVTPHVAPDAFIYEPLKDHRGFTIRPNGHVAMNERGEPRLRADYAGPIKPFIAFWDVGGFEGSFWDQVGGERVVQHVAMLCQKNGATVVHADQREAYMLAAAFKGAGLRFVEHPWTATSKPDAVDRVRRWFASNTIRLPNHPRLIQELHAFVEVPTPGGGFTFKARGSGHDDFVALLLTAALADIEGQIPRSPIALPAGMRFTPFETRL